MIQPEKEYSRKLIRRLENVFDSSQVKLVGGELDGQKVKARHLLILPELPSSLDTLEKVAIVNKLLPTATKDLLFESNYLLNREGYIAGLGSYDGSNLSYLAMVLAHREGFCQTAIRLIYGATKEMPFRALSYILPPLILMEQLSQDGISYPQLQVVFANNISARLNGIDIYIAREQSHRFVDIAEAYTREFFPKFRESTVFLEDTPLDKGTLLRSEILKVGRLISANSELREDLRMKGRNNGSQHSYIFYGAAHPLIQDADLPDTFIPITDDQPLAISRPKIIINFGGVQEKFFYDLRYKVKKYLGLPYNEIKTIQYFTRHQVPPYYMARDGDLALSDAILGKSVNIGQAAYYDLDYLREVSNRRGDFRRFLHRLKRNI